MIKTLLLAALLFPILTHAQTVPNGSFEQWSPDNTGAGANGELPTGWGSVGIGTIHKLTTGAQAGNTAVKIEGIVISGVGIASLLENNFHVTSAPKYLNGYFRKNTSGNDTLTISITTLNGGSGTGFSAGQTTDPSSGWTPFSIEIEYFNGTPAADSVRLAITVQGRTGGYDIDNVTLGGSAIGNPLAVKRSLRAGSLQAMLVPNPAVTAAQLNLGGLTAGSATVRIVDMLGKTAWSTTHAVQSDRQVIAIPAAGLTKGIYHIVVENAGRRSVVQFVKN